MSETATTTPEVQPETVVDAAAPQDFEAYEASRLAALTADPIEVDETETETEPATSETATEEETTPAAAVEPESVPASGTETETPEQKTEREKKRGDLIPQSRLDEVTKARREAERKAESEKARADALAAEVAQLKAVKPATEEVKPPATPVETKPAEATAELLTEPVMPDIPTLDQFEGDTDLWQAALKEFNKVEIPKFTRAQTKYDRQQEQIEEKQRIENETKAKRTKEEADAAAAAAVETETEVRTWNEQIDAVKTANPNFDELVNKTPSNPALNHALTKLDNGADVVWWLANHPEEAKRISELTGSIYETKADGLAYLKPGVTRAQVDKAVLKAAVELSKIDIGKTTTPPAAKPAEKAPDPKPPVNPKPAVSRAPSPPSTVTESSTVHKDGKTIAGEGDFAAYEKKRAPEVFRR